MVTARAGDRIFSLISMVILARLLVPEDFGLIAMATATVALLELFTSFGFDVALIQHPAATRKHYDTAWTFNIAIGALVAVVLFASATVAADFYGEPRVENVLRCLALAALIQGFQNIGIVAFRKELKFRKEFRLIIYRRLLAFSVTIPLAFILRSYWALVIGIVASRLLATALTYWLHEYRPRLSFAARRELLSFGKWIVVNNVLNFLGTRAADLIIGKFAGVRALGLFNIAYQVTSMVSSNLMAPINRAVFPGYAKKAGDLLALREGYVNVVGILTLVVAPACAGVASLSTLLVRVVLGDRWLDAAPALSALSLYGILLIFSSNSHYVYLALGRPHIATLLGTVHVIILIPFVFVGSTLEGANGAAMGFLVAQLLFTPFSLFVVHRTLAMTAWDLLRALYRPFIATAVMFIALRYVVGLLDPLSQNLAFAAGSLLVGVISGATSYFAVLYVAWRLAGMPDGAERLVMDFVISRWVSRRRTRESRV